MRAVALPCEVSPTRAIADEGHQTEGSDAGRAYDAEPPSVDTSASVTFTVVA